MAFSHISRPVRAVTDKSFASKFITLGRVIHYWADAVGPDLALKTYPIGMKVRKAQTEKTPIRPLALSQGSSEGKKEKPTKQRLEAILEIAASSADATLLHYQKAIILERLRALLGADMIVDIKITHAGAPVLGGSPLPPASPALTVMQKEEVGCTLSGVTDPDLYAVLERLGAYVVAERT